MKHTAIPPVKLVLPEARVCFWGAPAYTHGDTTTVSWQALLDETGGNTGNLFIGNGLYNATGALDKSYHPSFDRLSPEELDERFDIIFVPASNFLNPHADMTPAYDYLRRTKARIFCFGLGSQIKNSRDFTLVPGTEKLVRLLADRSDSIGVRGSFTAEVLDRIGIRNVSLTGCPSLMGLSDDIIDGMGTKPSGGRLAVNFSNNVRSHSFNPIAHRDTENGLFRHAVGLDSYYVLQNEDVELGIVSRLQQGQASEAEAGIRRMLEIFAMPSGDPEGEAYGRDRLRVFWNVREWIGCMTTMNRSVGTRFHGNVAAILAGTPAMFLVHDMRTLELVELFDLPHLVLNRTYGAEEIMERVGDLDYGPFRRRMHHMRTEWRLFAARNGIACGA